MASSRFGALRMSKEDVSFCSCARIGKGKDCRCGEEEDEFTWLWDPYSTQSDSTLMKDGREVIFHANYSSGTAAIRGTTPFREGHHFWEVKMTTPVYGTDMMVGVATADLELDKYVHTFCSLLGQDNNSWGLSYLGSVHHKGSSHPYSDKLGQGAIVGVHLDMWQGTLSFYVNRRPLGVAYRGLQGKALYPVVTSTAARSGMKVITTKWFPHSLQFQCCQTLRSYVQEDMYVLDAVSLPPGLNTFLNNNLGWLLRSYPTFPASVASPLWRYRHVMGHPFSGMSSEDRPPMQRRKGQQSSEDRSPSRPKKGEGSARRNSSGGEGSSQRGARCARTTSASHKMDQSGEEEEDSDSQTSGDAQAKNFERGSHSGTDANTSRNTENHSLSGAHFRREVKDSVSRRKALRKRGVFHSDSEMDSDAFESCSESVMEREEEEEYENVRPKGAVGTCANSSKSDIAWGSASPSICTKQASDSSETSTQSQASSDEEEEEKISAPPHKRKKTH